VRLIIFRSLLAYLENLPSEMPNHYPAKARKVTTPRRGRKQKEVAHA
jgi:hypothetical protein